MCFLLYKQYLSFCISIQYVCKRCLVNLYVFKLYCSNMMMMMMIGDERECAFLFQRLSILIQRFNAILLHDSFESADHVG